MVSHLTYEDKEKIWSREIWSFLVWEQWKEDMVWVWMGRCQFLHYSRSRDYGLIVKWKHTPDSGH